MKRQPGRGNGDRRGHRRAATIIAVEPVEPDGHGWLADDGDVPDRPAGNRRSRAQRPRWPYLVAAAATAAGAFALIRPWDGDQPDEAADTLPRPSVSPPTTPSEPDPLGAYTGPRYVFAGFDPYNAGISIYSDDGSYELWTTPGGATIQLKVQLGASSFVALDDVQRDAGRRGEVFTHLADPRHITEVAVEEQWRIELDTWGLKLPDQQRLSWTARSDGIPALQVDSLPPRAELLTTGASFDELAYGKRSISLDYVSPAGEELFLAVGLGDHDRRMQALSALAAPDSTPMSSVSRYTAPPWAPGQNVVMWADGTTMFSLASPTLTSDDLLQAAKNIEPVTADEFQRLMVPPPSGDGDEPQPFDGQGLTQMGSDSSGMWETTLRPELGTWYLRSPTNASGGSYRARLTARPKPTAQTFAVDGFTFVMVVGDPTTIAPGSTVRITVDGQVLFVGAPIDSTDGQYRYAAIGTSLPGGVDVELIASDGSTQVLMATVIPGDSAGSPAWPPPGWSVNDTPTS